ncbi:unnamed protein product [Lota lota]
MKRREDPEQRDFVRRTGEEEEPAGDHAASSLAEEEEGGGQQNRSIATPLRPPPDPRPDNLSTSDLALP